MTDQKHFKPFLLVPVGMTLSLCFILSVAAEPITYWHEGGHVEIPDAVPGNPIIYDNDWFFDVTCIDYLLAKNSIGAINFKGIVVTRDLYNDPPTSDIEGQVADCRLKLDLARNSGLWHVPDNVYRGATYRLQRPGSGVIDHTSYTPTDGSHFIVQQAHEASVEHPLIVNIGGQNTSVATAVLQDPSIRDKIVVFQLPGGYNDKDVWSFYLTMKTTRYVNYEWLNHEPGYWPDERWLSTPDNPLCNANKDKYYQGGWMRDHATRPLDGSMLVYLFDHRIFTTSQRRYVSFPGSWYQFQDTSADDFDVLYIAGTNKSIMSDEFFDTFNNPCVYDPASCGQGCEVADLIATPVSSSEIYLTWTEDCDNESGFTIQRRSYHGVNNWWEVASLPPNTTSYTDTDSLHGLVTYTYRVGAF